MSKKIAVMCGHGTQTNGAWDAGCSYGNNTEAGLMLPITKSAVKYLRSYGLTVISDADKNNNRNMISDVSWANSQKCEIYVSIHCDYSKAPSGVMPLYVSSAGKKLATALNTAISKGMPIKSRGVCKRTDLYELNATDMPACILETGSIKADLNILKKDYEKYGKLIAEGICKYLGVSIKADSKPAETSKPLFRVRKTWADEKSQIGAYSVLANAKAECDKHAGYSVYDENGKAVYTSKATPKPTNMDKLVAKAKDLAWAKGTKESKYAYKGGSPTTKFKNALNKIYPNRKLWGDAPRVGAACDVYVGVVVNSAGIGISDYPRGLNEQIKYKNDKFKILEYKNVTPYSVSKDGDIVQYYKNAKGTSKHTLIRADGVIYEAQLKLTYGHVNTSVKSKLDVKRPYVRILRAK